MIVWATHQLVTRKVTDTDQFLPASITKTLVLISLIQSAVSVLSQANLKLTATLTRISRTRTPEYLKSDDTTVVPTFTISSALPSLPLPA